MNDTTEASVLRLRATSLKWHVQRDVAKANRVAPKYQDWLFDKHDHPDWKEAERLLLKCGMSEEEAKKGV